MPAGREEKSFVVGFVQIADHHPSGTAGMDEFVLAKVDADMGNSSSPNLEEDKVTFLQFVFRYGGNILVNSATIARDGNVVATVVDDGSKVAAVYSSLCSTTPTIGSLQPGTSRLIDFFVNDGIDRET